jgi:hypothetical protein
MNLKKIGFIKRNASQRQVLKTRSGAKTWMISFGGVMA